MLDLISLIVGLVADLFGSRAALEAEILALYETEDFEMAAKRVAQDVEIAALTRSEHGSVILSGSAPLARNTRRIDGGSPSGRVDALLLEELAQVEADDRLVLGHEDALGRRGGRGRRGLTHVPGAGLEPARPRGQRILSPPCLPFHHPGRGAVSLSTGHPGL